MKRLLFLVLCAAAASQMNAQQDPQYTQWMYDKISFNPAFAGLGCDECCAMGNGGHGVTLFYRDQWDGLNRDPKTAMFNYNGNFGKLFGPGQLGGGLVVYSDNLGQEQNSLFRLNASYILPLGNNFLSIGLGAGRYTKKFGQDWIAVDGIAGDPLIPVLDRTDNAFNMSAGVYFTDRDKFYVGASTNNLTQSEIELEALNLSINRHYYFMGGYNYSFSPDFVLRSNLLAKSDLVEYIADVNVNAMLYNSVWVGATYRTQDAIAPMAGFKYCFDAEGTEQITHYCLRVGYSYDATTSALRNYSAGSHEVFATLCLNFEKKIIRKPFTNPRFL